LRRKNFSGTRKKLKGYSDDVLQVELDAQRVLINGKEVSLTPTEFKLLAFFVRNPQKTLSTRTLLSEIWGDVYSHDKSLLSLYIHQIRQKLRGGGASHEYIKTQWGQGYWFNSLEQTKEPDKEVESVKKTPSIKLLDERNYGAIWFAIILILFIAAWQAEQTFGFFSGIGKKGTELEALMTTDGFIEDGESGVDGQICVSNTGNFSTQNLAVVATVQSIGKNVGNLYTTSLDVSAHPVLEADETHCYPYKLFIDTLKNADTIKVNAIITITNYVGLHPGSNHCPGEDPCAFGPNLLAEFTFPKP
jgi:DNA-binding winged helix-turn-helix (wHTH) protein